MRVHALENGLRKKVIVDDVEFFGEAASTCVTEFGASDASYKGRDTRCKTYYTEYSSNRGDIVTNHN